MTLKENYTFDPCFPLDNLCYVFQIYHDCSHYACRKQEPIFIHNCQNKSFVTTQLLQYVKSVLSSFYEQYWTFFFPFSSSYTYLNLLWVQLFSFNFIFSFIILVLFKESSQYVVIYGPVQPSLRRVLPDLLMCTLPVKSWLVIGCKSCFLTQV